MTILYKITDRDCKTRAGEQNECQWGEGVSHSGTGEGELCSAGWIHAYTDPLLAVLLNPIHGSYKDIRLWEAEGEISKDDHGLKVGCQTLTTIREIPAPEVTTEQRIRFAIFCALEVYREPTFIEWANAWLSGEDRSPAAAAWAAWAAAAAAWAAWAAAAAAWAAAEARAAAEAAAWAAERAAMAHIDLAAIARRAIT